MFGFAQSAEKLQLYKLFLLENNKNANQNCPVYPDIYGFMSLVILIE